MTTTDRRGLVVGSPTPSVAESDPSAELAIKTPVHAATTANITLSGEQTIDGVSVVADNRVLVKNQTDATQNGIYMVSSGNWSRSTDFDATREVVEGTLVYVCEGTANGGVLYAVTTSDPITIDSSSIAFSPTDITLVVDGTPISGGTTLGVFYDNAGTFGNSTALQIRATAGYQFVGVGDAIATGISRATGTKPTALMLSRLVNWSSINDATIVDYTTLTAQDSVSNQYASFAAYPIMTSTAYNWNHLIGFEDLGVVQGTGTLTNDASFYSSPTINAGVTVTNRRGMWVNDASGSGTITNNYGLYCEALSRGSANWAVYTSGSTPSYYGGNLLIGTAGTAPTIPALTINKNAAAPSTPVSGTVLQLVNADASSTIIAPYSYGTTAAPLIETFKARGTGASPTAAQSGDTLFSLQPVGYGATGFGGSSAALNAVAAENFTDSAKGAYWSFYTVATGSISAVERFRVATGLIGTSSSANAFVVGPNGSTNPSLNVDASTSSAATGLNVKSAAAAAGLAISVTSSGSNENLTLDAKGTGSVTIGGTSTGPAILRGTATNDSAAAGFIGEYKESKTTGSSATVTISNASPGLVSWSGHGLNIGSGINFTTTGGLPTGLSVGTNYYISSQNFGSNSFCVSTSVANALAGTSVNTSSAGSGTHTGISTVLLTTGNQINITGISLTPGDWDVSLLEGFVTGTGTVVTVAVVSTSTTSATLDTSIDRLSAATLPNGGMTMPNAATLYLGLGPVRFSLSATTTVYFISYQTFGTSTLAGTGIIRARRVR